MDLAEMAGAARSGFIRHVAVLPHTGLAFLGASSCPELSPKIF